MIGDLYLIMVPLYEGVFLRPVGLVFIVLNKSTLFFFFFVCCLNKLPVRPCDLGEGIGRCTDIGVCCA